MGGLGRSVCLNYKSLFISLSVASRTRARVRVRVSSGLQREVSRRIT